MFALDRAGLVGADGATHAGAFDIAYLRCIPNMTVVAPADENECRQMLTTAFLQDHPVAVRYPRGAGAGVAVAAGADRRCRSARAKCARAGQADRDPRLRLAAAPGAGSRPSSSTRPSSTCASSSRSTRSCAAAGAPRTTRWSRVEEGAIMGGAGSAVLRGAARPQASNAGAAARPARPLHRPWRPGAAAGVRAGWTPPASSNRSSALRRYAE